MPIHSSNAQLNTFFECNPFMGQSTFMFEQLHARLYKSNDNRLFRLMVDLFIKKGVIASKENWDVLYKAEDSYTFKSLVNAWPGNKSDYFNILSSGPNAKAYLTSKGALIFYESTLARLPEEMAYFNERVKVLGNFFDDPQEFLFANFDFSKSENLKSLNWEGSNKNTLPELLKTYQFAYHLCGGNIEETNFQFDAYMNDPDRIPEPRLGHHPLNSLKVPPTSFGVI